MSRRLAASSGYWQGAAAVASRTFSMPAMSRLSSEESMRDQGLSGLNFTGHRILLGTDRFVYFVGIEGSGSFNPGDFDSSLVGRSGIEVIVPAGNQSRSAMATLAAAAINADGRYTATPAGVNVTVFGTSSVAFGSVDYDTGGYGLRGCQYSRALVGGPYFDSAQLRGARLDLTALPANPFVVTGMRYVQGDVHAAQVPVALYQGGTGAGDFENATLLGVIGVSSGSATDTVLYSPCPTPFLVDPSAGNLWVMWMHDAGDVTMPFPGVGTGAQTTSDYALSGGNGIFISAAGPSSSDPADFPATAPAIGGGTFASIPTFALSYVEADAMPSNMVPQYRFGTRQNNTAVFAGVSALPLFVGDSYTNPDVEGLELIQFSIAYDTHVLNSNYRASYCEGGTADANYSTASYTDVGIPGEGGTATGWVDRDLPTPIPMAPAVRSWLTIHFDGSGSALAFVDDTDVPNTYSPPDNPAPFINDGVGGITQASECEVDDGSLGGTPTTNYTYDPALTQSDPLPVPNGTIYTNNNFVGVRALARVGGASIAA